MKYFKTFEGFKKSYMKKIDLKDFKKIKKGSKIMYMGGEAEVVDNNGYVLTLKKDGKKFTVNKSMFDHGGMIREGKAPNANKALKDLERKGSQIDWLDDADDDTKKIWKKAGVNTEDENTVILYSYVSHQWDDAKKILKKHNVDFKELEDPNSAGESFIVFVKESKITEAITPPITFEFPDERSAKQFDLDIENSAIGIGDQIGNKVTVTDVDTKWRSTVKKFLKKNKGKVIKESVVNELKRTLVSGTMSGSTQSLEDRKYELKKDAKGATIGNFSNVTLPKGTIIYNLPGGVFADHFSLKNKYASRSSQGPQYFDKPTFKGIMIKQTPAVLSYIEKNSKVLESFDIEITEAANVPSNIAEFAKRRGVLKDVKQIARWAEKAGKRITGGTAIGKNYDTLILDLTYQGGEIRYDTVRGTFTLNGEPVDSWKTFSKAVNESSERDGTEASDGKHKHNDHLEEDMEAMWKKAYGEKFASKYPGVAKIIRQRKITDKREIARIWQETYGENFKEEYPAMWDMMSK